MPSVPRHHVPGGGHMPPPAAQWPTPGPAPAPGPATWAPPGAGTAHRHDDRPPTLLTLVAATVWRLAVSGAAYHFATSDDGPDMSSESLSYLSNVGVALAFLALAIYPALVAGRRHEPRTGWLRGAVTVTMLLVGLVFVVGMDGEPDGPHAVVPALVLADWFFVGRNQLRTRGWEPLTWIAFPLAYLVYHQANDVPLYDFLDDDQIGTAVPLLLAGVIVLGYLIYGAAMLRRAATGGSSTASTSPSPARW